MDERGGEKGLNVMDTAGFGRWKKMNTIGTQKQMVFLSLQLTSQFVP
ncbi:hypothetical protein SAMN04488063_1106 [Halopelagius inordinatus]|uniref:Uncharacterized protein n=1 Tax=Halopelagius inordinatus TaxID=553467 RepID=A0A1I2NGD4_9EURY|nr:hypothetical protein SAMN04488063_1106 [Halopelagius inordinatus]